MSDTDYKKEFSMYVCFIITAKSSWFLTFKWQRKAPSNLASSTKSSSDVASPQKQDATPRITIPEDFANDEDEDLEQESTEQSSPEKPAEQSEDKKSADQSDGSNSSKQSENGEPPDQSATSEPADQSAVVTESEEDYIARIEREAVTFLV